MRSGDPEPNLDPYRTLGLEAGASMAEVKRAYRLLAKAFHPDSAGETALPRFLAIHAAYEQIRTGRIVATPRATQAPAAEPWRADPARARAARERARTGRKAPTGSTGATGTTGAARATGTTGSSAGRAGTSGAAGSARASGTAGAAGTAGPAGARGAPGTRGSGRRRDVRKATMGSTSYDEARDPADATWSGASWYGPTSGEYWIVNPREYADPRKHGPDYQQRARRPADADVDSTEAPEPVAATSGSGTTTIPPDEPRATPDRPRRAAPGVAGWAREAADSAWAASSAASSAAKPAAGSDGSGATRRRPGEAGLDVDRVEAFGEASRAWLGGSTDDPIRRLGLALVAWPPIGLAAAAAIGEVTGCNAFSAACGGTEPLLPWLAQAAILGLLLLLPPVTRVLVGGAVAVLLALVPITTFLVAIGGAGAPQAGFAMAILLAVAWLVGIAWSARASWQGRVARSGP